MTHSQIYEMELAHLYVLFAILAHVAVLDSDGEDGVWTGTLGIHSSCPHNSCKQKQGNKYWLINTKKYFVKLQKIANRWSFNKFSFKFELNMLNYNQELTNIMTKNILTRRKESDTYLAIVSRHRWASSADEVPQCWLKATIFHQFSSWSTNSSDVYWQ